MDNEQIAAKFAEYENRIKVSEHRLTDLEMQNKAISEIAMSTKTLATNMEYMAKEQTKQGERLERLEREPADNSKYYKKIAIGCVITGVVGFLVGVFIKLITG